jgi:hypothetical protein
MRNFVYVSKEKINLFFPQIPEKFSKSVSKELGLNFGLLKMGIKKKPSEPDANTKKLLIVEKFLQENDIGTFAYPGQFVLDKCELSWCTFHGWPETDMVYFCGVTQESIEIGLGGSPWHLFGGKRPNSASVSSSEPGFILKALEKYQETISMPKIEIGSLKTPNKNLKRRGYELKSMRELRSVCKNSPFNTRTLSVTIDFEVNQYYLGTPIYVELL